MEISEAQRKQAIVNARRAKQGKSKGEEVFFPPCSAPFSHPIVSNVAHFSIHFIFLNIFFLLLVHLFSHRLLWLRPAAPPEPAPTSPASHHHPHQRASAAGLLTGRAPQTKALPPALQHHPQRLLQEMTLLLPHSFFCCCSFGSSSLCMFTARPKPSRRHKEHFTSSFACECTVKVVLFFLFFLCLVFVSLGVSLIVPCV